jgi:hypothetical protein
MQRRLAGLDGRTPTTNASGANGRQAAVTKSAIQLGFQDPVDAYALLDRAALEHDDQGAPKGVDKLLRTPESQALPGRRPPVRVG